MRFTNNN